MASRFFDEEELVEKSKSLQLKRADVYAYTVADQSMLRQKTREATIVHLQLRLSIRENDLDERLEEVRGVLDVEEDACERHTHAPYRERDRDWIERGEQSKASVRGLGWEFSKLEGRRGEAVRSGYEGDVPGIVCRMVRTTRRLASSTRCTS